jgi:hypothetical protein
MSAYSRYFWYKGSSFQSEVFESSVSWKLVTLRKTVTFSIKFCSPRACREKAEPVCSLVAPASSLSFNSCSQMETTFSSFEPAR